MKKQEAIKELSEEAQNRVKGRIKELVLTADRYKTVLDKIEKEIEELEAGDLTSLNEQNVRDMGTGIYTGRYEKD